MLNFERQMLTDGEVDLMEVLTSEGRLVEYDGTSHIPDDLFRPDQDWPLVWQWTLQDREGRIWTELVDDDA